MPRRCVGCVWGCTMRSAVQLGPRGMPVHRLCTCLLCAAAVRGTQVTDCTRALHYPYPVHTWPCRQALEDSVAADKQLGAIGAVSATREWVVASGGMATVVVSPGLQLVSMILMLRCGQGPRARPDPGTATTPRLRWRNAVRGGRRGQLVVKQVGPCTSRWSLTHN